MTLFPWRLIVVTLALALGLGFLMGTLHWQRVPYACFGGKRFYEPWFVSFQVGRVELRQKAWGCPPGDRYDPKEFKPANLTEVPAP